MIEPGQRVPDATLQEYVQTEGPGCSIGPRKLQVLDELRGKRVVVFGLPGAFTPTCSAKHVPGYLEQHDALMAAGVAEIWCVSVNDAFVMGAWARDEGTEGKIRMLADGGADWTRALGLDAEIPGMGVRSRRYSMLIEDGTVHSLNLEEAGKFEVSDAATMLGQLRA
jgi:peroxiredoxin